jgi:hypothetical protein
MILANFSSADGKVHQEVRNYMEHESENNWGSSAKLVGHENPKSLKSLLIERDGLNICYRL